MPGAALLLITLLAPLSLARAGQDQISFVAPWPGAIITEGTVLVAAQAAFSRAEYDRGGDPDVQAHDGLQAAYLDSIRRLQGLGAGSVLFSHDA